MSKPVTPGWPQPGAFPFMPFPLPGTTAGQTPPLAGLPGGIDLVKEFWGRMPGANALPGFLVPTIDVEELDKRIGDLKAAEQWVEVNLNMLRATIQGLEVQRHTIAAIQALTTPAPEPSKASSAGTTESPRWPMPPPEPPPAASSAPTPDAPVDAKPASNDWLAYLQAQFATVAQAAMTPSTTSPTSDGANARKAKKVVAPARKTSKPR